MRAVTGERPGSEAVVLEELRRLGHVLRDIHEQLGEIRRLLGERSSTNRAQTEAVQK